MSYSHCRKCGKEILSVNDVEEAYCKSCKWEYKTED